MIKIEKGIPIPEKEFKRGGNFKYPFKDMEIGDSFEVEVAKYKDMRSLAASLKSSSERYCIKLELSYKFEMRNTEKGIRVWRVE